MCLLGETIIDEWVDVTVTNLSIKSRCVAGLETGRSRQIGGAGVIALHLAGFVKEVHCFTNGLSDADAGQRHRDAPGRADLLVKTRFVDRDNGYRLFESKSPDLKNVQPTACPTSTTTMSCSSPTSATACSTRGRSTRASPAIGARSWPPWRRSNSTNYGYNLPTKYAGADYYSVNRTEAELCLHERNLPLSEILERMSALLRARALSVTDGEHGVMVKRGDDVFALPTLSTSVVDTIGCGDAYFALSSLAAALGCPTRVVALAGSIGAAAVAQRRGNESPISEQEFLTIGKIVI